MFMTSNEMAKTEVANHAKSETARFGFVDSETSIVSDCPMEHCQFGEKKFQRGLLKVTQRSRLWTRGEF